MYRDKEKLKEILNYTPHSINIEGKEPMFSNGSARVNETAEIIDNLNGIDVISKTLGAVEGLPNSVDNVFYVVSLIVAQALPLRKDLLIPGELLRDEKGAIVGCKNLCRM